MCVEGATSDCGRAGLSNSNVGELVSASVLAAKALLVREATTFDPVVNLFDPIGDMHALR